MPKGREGLVRLVESEGVSKRVVDAFRAVAREDFVPEAARPYAYRDRPIAILEQQTTSQPSLIARMIDAAAVEPDDHVLEIGTGFGFQTALLAHVAADVVSVERFESIADVARTNLDRAGIENATVVVGDGWQGWVAGAPYDAIVVSAAASEVPPALVEQLTENGRLVIPVRAARGDDVLGFTKRGAELSRPRLVTPARFVPLVPDSPQGFRAGN